MTEPLVSVKMITYNHAPFIAQAIEGVLSQKTNFPFELVIGEDCSTDGTKEIVFEYQKKYPDIIRVITSDKNVGMKKNGYRTTKACRGKYIAFCEGDDYWHHPGKMKKQADYLENHPECGLVFADCDIHYVKSGKLMNSFNYSKGFCNSATLTIDEVIYGVGLVRFTCTAMLRRSLAEQVIENDPYLHQNEKYLMGDTQLWTELALLSEVSYIPETLATYRVLVNSASRNRDAIKVHHFRQSACEMMLYLIEKHNLSDNIRRKAELEWYDNSLRIACYERNAELADEIRAKKKTFTWKEWARYYGARNVTIHIIYRASAYFVDLFRSRNKQWP